MTKELHLKIDNMHLLRLHSMLYDKYLQFVHLIGEANKNNE